jgi:hypothetical protein
MSFFIKIDIVSYFIICSQSATYNIKNDQLAQSSPLDAIF